MDIHNIQEAIGIMDIADVEFYAAEGGFTGLKYKGADYPHIVLRRIMPTQQPFNYISVADSENKEIGILKAVEDLSVQQQEIVKNELANRYYSPHIVDVKSLQDKLGYVYIEMRLRNDNGVEYDKNCAIRDVNRNIRTSKNKLTVKDVDGNIYVVQDISSLNKRSLKLLSAYLF